MLHNDEDLTPHKTRLHRGSVILARWEIETGEPLETYRPVNMQKRTRDSISNKVKGKNQCLAFKAEGCPMTSTHKSSHTSY